MRVRAGVASVLLMGSMVAGCGGDSGVTLSTIEGGVVIGEGVVPPAIPDDFPRRSGSTIGASRIDRSLHRTEMEVLDTAPLTTVVTFYTIGLVNQGFVTTSSSATAQGWLIEFVRDELIGSITVESVEGGGTRTIVTVNGT